MVTGGRRPPSRKLSQSYRWSYAAGIVIGQPIQLYYPPITAQFQTSPFTCVVSRRGQAAARKASIVIMWSTGESVLAVGPVAINHFVPLQRRAVPRVVFVMKLLLCTQTMTMTMTVKVIVLNKTT